MLTSGAPWGGGRTGVWGHAAQNHVKTIRSLNNKAKTIRQVVR
jgi:hypothetical protein